MIRPASPEDFIAVIFDLSERMTVSNAFAMSMNCTRASGANSGR